jgi:hypothetical protein
MSGAVLSHHYGVIHVGVPVLCGEGIKCVRRGRIELSILLAVCIGASPLLVTIPMMLHGQAGLLAAIRQCPGFFGRPRLHDLSEYSAMTPLFFPGVAAIASAILVAARLLGYRAPKLAGIPEEEMAAALGLSFLVPIMLLCTRLTSGYFMPRYAIGTALGLALLCGLLLPHLGPKCVTARIALGMAAFAFSMSMLGVVAVSRNSLLSGADGDSLLRRAPEGLPIVIADPLRFSPAWWRADPRLRMRLHYLGDVSYSIQQPAFLPEYSLFLEQHFIPVKLDGYREFLSTHSQFVLVSYGVEGLEWVKGRLAKDHWHFYVLSRDGAQTMYEVTSRDKPLNGLLEVQP